MRNAAWILTFDKNHKPSHSDPMGWLEESDMNQELTLRFPSLLKAIEYANKHGLTYTVITPPRRIQCIRSYGENFVGPRRRT